jgi:hypothetical protein
LVLLLLTVDHWLKFFFITWVQNLDSWPWAFIGTKFLIDRVASYWKPKGFTGLWSWSYWAEEIEKVPAWIPDADGCWRMLTGLGNRSQTRMTIETWNHLRTEIFSRSHFCQIRITGTLVVQKRYILPKYMGKITRNCG